MKILLTATIAVLLLTAVAGALPARHPGHNFCQNHGGVHCPVR